MSVCTHYKFGHCKYGNQCRNRHIQLKCENKECDLKQCDKRHPNECKYFRDYKRCKFGNYCSYEHVVHVDPVLNEVFILKTKLEAIEKEILLKNEEIKRTLERIELALANHNTTLLYKPNRSPSIPNSVVVTNSSMSNPTPPQAKRDEPPRVSPIPQFDGYSGLLTQSHQNLPREYQPQLVLAPEHEGVLSNKECDNCHKVFETADQLAQHNETYGFGCEDCFICYTSKLNVDLHELEMHPDTSYAREHIPTSTKLHFASRSKPL